MLLNPSHFHKHKKTYFWQNIQYKNHTTGTFWQGQFIMLNGLEDLWIVWILLQLGQSMVVGIDLSVDPIDNTTFLALASSFDQLLTSYHFGVKRLSERPDMNETGSAIAALLVEGIRCDLLYLHNTFIHICSFLISA